jgi:hypothetical protein
MRGEGALILEFPTRAAKSKKKEPTLAPLSISREKRLRCMRPPPIELYVSMLVESSLETDVHRWFVHLAIRLAAERSNKTAPTATVDFVLVT